MPHKIEMINSEFLFLFFNIDAEDYRMGSSTRKCERPLLNDGFVLRAKHMVLIRNPQDGSWQSYNDPSETTKLYWAVGS